MTIAPVQDFEQIVWPQDIMFPRDLDSNEPELETYQHLQQLVYLLTSLEWWWRDRSDFFAAGNLTVYYSHRAEEHLQRAEQEAQRAAEADRRADRLAAQLRSLGVEPD